MSRSVGSVPAGLEADGLDAGAGAEATSSDGGAFDDGVFIGGGV
jgi:hypothetical protein